MTQLNEISH